MSDPEQVQKKFNQVLRSKAQREMHARNAGSKLAELTRRADRLAPHGADGATPRRSATKESHQ